MLHHRSPIIIPLFAAAIAAGLMLIPPAANPVARADEAGKNPHAQPDREQLPSGFRRLTAQKYGVSVVILDSWSPLGPGSGDRAFRLRLPNDHPNEDSAVVQCTIGLAPTSLKEYQQRIAAREQDQNTGRKLASHEIQQLAPRKAAAAKKGDDGTEAKPSSDHVLEAVWTFDRGRQGTWYEVKRYVIRNGYLYVYSLLVDQGHFEAYRLNLRDMVASARYEEAETGVVQLPQNYWMERRYNFGLQLPEGWKPSFRLLDEVLFFATGNKDEVWTDNLVVTASRPEKLDFDQLRKQQQEEIPAARKGAKVTSCQVVQLGNRDALETVVTVSQGRFNFTIVEYRIAGERLNYQVRFTVLSENYEKLAPALKKSAASIKEFPQPGKGRVI